MSDIRKEIVAQDEAIQSAFAACMKTAAQILACFDDSYLLELKGHISGTVDPTKGLGKLIDAARKGDDLAIDALWVIIVAANTALQAELKGRHDRRYKAFADKGL